MTNCRHTVQVAQEPPTHDERDKFSILDRNKEDELDRLLCSSLFVVMCIFQQGIVPVGLSAGYSVGRLVGQPVGRWVGRSVGLSIGRQCNLFLKTWLIKSYRSASSPQKKKNSNYFLAIPIGFFCSNSFDFFFLTRWKFFHHQNNLKVFAFALQIIN